MTLRFLTTQTQVCLSLGWGDRRRERREEEATTFRCWTNAGMFRFSRRCTFLSASINQKPKLSASPETQSPLSQATEDSFCAPEPSQITEAGQS